MRTKIVRPDNEGEILDGDNLEQIGLPVKKYYKKLVRGIVLKLYSTELVTDKCTYCKIYAWFIIRVLQSLTTQT